MANKGLTYIELLIVLGLIPVIIGITIGVFKIQEYFAKTRDLQRIQDLNLLNNALNFYFQNATSVDPDGPNLTDRGVDENLPTIFVSVPTEKDKFFESCFYYPNGKTYYIYQTN
ncbi:MAG: type II secretion system protein, partial [Endomicrobiia bacterium]